MNPVTRKEVFLDAICDGEPCTLEPASREEQVLKKLAESMVGGGGGSSECDWNTMKNKPFDAKIETEPLFNGNVEMVGEDVGGVYVTTGRINTTAPITDEIIVTINGVSVITNVDGGFFMYDDRKVNIDYYGEYELGFRHGGNRTYTIENISIDGVTNKEITTIPTMYLPDEVLTVDNLKDKVLEGIYLMGDDFQTYRVYVDAEGNLKAKTLY